MSVSRMVKVGLVIIVAGIYIALAFLSFITIGKVGVVGHGDVPDV